MSTINYNEKKFQKITSKVPSGFMARQAIARRERKDRLRSAQLAFSVLAILDYKKMSKAELAQKMDVSAQQVSKLLKGKNNFTFETVGKLEEALGVKLIEVCTIDFEREARKAEFVMKAMIERTVKVKTAKKIVSSNFTTKENFNYTKIVEVKGFDSIDIADKNLQPTG